MPIVSHADRPLPDLDHLAHVALVDNGDLSSWARDRASWLVGWEPVGHDDDEQHQAYERYWEAVTLYTQQAVVSMAAAMQRVQFVAYPNELVPTETYAETCKRERDELRTPALRALYDEAVRCGACHEDAMDVAVVHGEHVRSSAKAKRGKRKRAVA